MPNNLHDAKKALLQRREALRQDRSEWLEHWREVRDYILPDHGRGLDSDSDPTEDTDGDKRMSSIYDGTASRAMDVLGAGMQSGLTLPSRPWFKFGTQDTSQQDKPDVRSWLYVCEERVRAVLARSNCYHALHHAYLELGGFGTAAIGVFEDFDKVVRFRALTAGEYMVGVNAKGLVDTLYRDIWMTAAQMVEEFGEENVSRSVLNAFKNGGTETRFHVIHATEPNDGRIKLKIPGNKKWRSVYFEFGGEKDKILRLQGFEEFPYLCPRWFVVGNQAYGRAPGMRVLPDVKQLQKETEKKLVGLDKLMDPPVVSPGMDANLQVNTFPGGVSQDPSGGTSNGTGLRPLYQVNLPLQYMLMDIQDLRQQIRDGLFNNLFQMISQQPADGRMTAREVAERHEEKMTLLGPALERLHSELLGPLIDRVFAIMSRLGLLPDAPEELQGSQLKVEYISILAQAQRMAGIGAIEQGMAFAGNLMSVFPEARDKIDADEAIEVYFDRIGVPPSVIVPDDVVAANRDRRAQQQAQQQALAAAPVAADAAKVLSETNLGGNTALNTLLGVLPNGLGSPAAG